MKKINKVVEKLEKFVLKILAVIEFSEIVTAGITEHCDAFA